jgi:hypothetical protein
MLPSLKVVQLTFEPENLGKLYSYYTHVPLNPGDQVVVKVKHGLDGNIFKVAHVVGTEGLCRQALDAATKCIVCRIDEEEHDKVEEELTAVKELKNELMARKEQLDEALIYSRLAESDPIMKQMIDRLNGLVPNSIPTLGAPAKGEDDVKTS